jgi:hypothetical protein
MRLILAFVLLLQPLSAQEGENLAEEVRRLIEVYSLVEQQYADPIDPAPTRFSTTCWRKTPFSRSSW